MVLIILCVKGIDYARCVRAKSSQKDVLSSHYAKKHIIGESLFAIFIIRAGWGRPITSFPDTR